jgi:hypothetical protein
LAQTEIDNYRASTAESTEQAFPQQYYILAMGAQPPMPAAPLPSDTDQAAKPKPQPSSNTGSSETSLYEGISLDPQIRKWRENEPVPSIEQLIDRDIRATPGASDTDKARVRDSIQTALLELKPGESEQQIGELIVGKLTASGWNQRTAHGVVEHALKEQHDMLFDFASEALQTIYADTRLPTPKVYKPSIDRDVAEEDSRLLLKKAREEASRLADIAIQDVVQQLRTTRIEEYISSKVLQDRNRSLWHGPGTTNFDEVHDYPALLPSLTRVASYLGQHYDQWYQNRTAIGQLQDHNKILDWLGAKDFEFSIQKPN